MPPTLAVWIVNVFALYAVIGVLFGLFFVVRGVSRIDPVAADGTWGFRLLILPGSAALWPLLLVRWLRAGDGSGPPTETNAHRRAARAARTSGADS